MTDAYVHVEAEPGETSRVAAALDCLEFVSAVHVVTGEFDVIARLDLDDPGVETHDWLQTEIEEGSREGVVAAAKAELGAVEGVAAASTSLAFEP